MKREMKIDQTYFLSETKTSTPMKSNHLKERIVFLPHPSSGILAVRFGECTFPKFDSYDPADVCSENLTMFFLVESDPNLELFVPGRSHSVLFGGDGKNRCFSLPES